MNEIFNIGFINYLNNNIEADYFLELISDIANETSKHINLYIASSTLIDTSFIENQFLNIYKFDDYNSTEFQKTIKNIDLGIVPSLIEETISISSVEFLKNNVAILTGTKGDDSELSDCELFKFENKEEFLEKFEK